MLVVSGLHCLPLWLYICRRGFPLPLWIQALGILLLGGGRLLALSVEVQYKISNTNIVYFSAVTNIDLHTAYALFHLAKNKCPSSFLILSR